MKTAGFYLLAVFFLIVITENGSVAALYQWQDGKGGVHFTDNPESIPAAYRKKATVRDLNDHEIPPVSDTAKPVDRQQGEPLPALQKDTSPPEKGMEYWQMRYGSLRSELKRLKDGLGTKKEEMSSYRHKWLVSQKRVEHQNMNQVEGEIAKDETRIKELEKQLEALDVEAARNAVPLDWRK